MIDARFRSAKEVVIPNSLLSLDDSVKRVRHGTVNRIIWRVPTMGLAMGIHGPETVKLRAFERPESLFRRIVRCFVNR